MTKTTINRDSRFFLRIALVAGAAIGLSGGTCRLAHAEPGRIPEGFMSGPAGTLVPETPPAPEPNWDDLVALVQAGASIKDVAAAARIDGRKLSGRVQGARNKKRVAEPAEPCVAPPLPGPPLFLEIDPGDVIPHPDAVAARATRASFLAGCAESGSLMIGTHLPGRTAYRVEPADTGFRLT